MTLEQDRVACDMDLSEKSPKWCPSFGKTNFPNSMSVSAFYSLSWILPLLGSPDCSFQFRRLKNSDRANLYALHEFAANLLCYYWVVLPLLLHFVNSFCYTSPVLSLTTTCSKEGERSKNDTKRTFSEAAFFFLAQWSYYRIEGVMIRNFLD